jgi:hypothetical protein
VKLREDLGIFWNVEVAPTTNNHHSIVDDKARLYDGSILLRLWSVLLLFRLWVATNGERETAPGAAAIVSSTVTLRRANAVVKDHAIRLLIMSAASAAVFSMTKINSEYTCRVTTDRGKLPAPFAASVVSSQEPTLSSTSKADTAEAVKVVKTLGNRFTNLLLTSR